MTVPDLAAALALVCDALDEHGAYLERAYSLTEREQGQRLRALAARARAAGSLPDRAGPAMPPPGPETMVRAVRRMERRGETTP